MRRSFANAHPLFAVAVMGIVPPLTVPIIACAQSFNATGTIIAGAGAITTDIGATKVSADTPNLVINWSPNDTAMGGGPINFQTAGTQALFTNRGSPSLTVLNRIIPTDVRRPIVFNGTVTSQLVDPGTGAISPGGTLFFYSPGGILVSSTGSFNVGNLALTTSDPNFDAATGIFGTSSNYNFLPANADSGVEVQSGAQIATGAVNANAALVAPKVNNSGTNTIDSSAVIVAVDASTITFQPDGLYDIQIDQGTVKSPVEQVGAAQPVTLVAVPRNDAITMAIKGGAALGFDVAGAAAVDGNAVVLSAGYGNANGVIDTIRAKFGAGPADAIMGTSQWTGETANPAANPAHSCLRDAAATDEGAFISVGGIGSTLDVQGNRQIVGQAQTNDTAVTADPTGSPSTGTGRGTGTNAANAARNPEADFWQCEP